MPRKYKAFQPCNSKSNGYLNRNFDRPYLPIQVTMARCLYDTFYTGSLSITNMSIPSEVDVHSAVDAALDTLFVNDCHLLSVDASERSLSHMLAVRLLSYFPNHQVDCEYNRDGFDVKKLMLSERQAKDDEVEAVTVFPDIIVHKRGKKDQNVLVIEMKKASSSANHDYDIQKLKAFKNELKYWFAAHIVIGYTNSGALVREVKWQ